MINSSKIHKHIIYKEVSQINECDFHLKILKFFLKSKYKQKKGNNKDENEINEIENK